MSSPNPVQTQPPADQATQTAQTLALLHLITQSSLAASQKDLRRARSIYPSPTSHPTQRLTATLLIPWRQTIAVITHPTARPPLTIALILAIITLALIIPTIALFILTASATLLLAIITIGLLTIITSAIIPILIKLSGLDPDLNLPLGLAYLIAVLTSLTTSGLLVYNLASSTSLHTLALITLVTLTTITYAALWSATLTAHYIQLLRPLTRRPAST